MTYDYQKEPLPLPKWQKIAGKIIKIAIIIIFCFAVVFSYGEWVVLKYITHDTRVLKSGLTAQQATETLAHLMLGASCMIFAIASFMLGNRWKAALFAIVAVAAIVFYHWRMYTFVMEYAETHPITQSIHSHYHDYRWIFSYYAQS